MRNAATVFDGFFDDAAIFPPGRAPLDRAVREHVARRSTPLAALVGPLLLTPAHLDDAARHYAELDATGPLRVGLVVGVGAVADALAAADRVRPGIEVSGLELKTDAADVAATVTQGAALAQRFDVRVELSTDLIRAGALRHLENTPVRLKVRTGGLVPEAFPTTDDLATMLRAAADTATSFKLTAGLHRAVRYADPTTGFAHHGFLNIAVATGHALQGADRSELSGILAERRGDAVAERFRALDPTWRELFESFGTCSITEPVATLAELGLASDHSLSRP